MDFQSISFKCIKKENTGEIMRELFGREKEENLQGHFFSSFASLYFSENGEYLTFTHFAWYEQRLAAQITH